MKHIKEFEKLFEDNSSEIKEHDIVTTKVDIKNIPAGINGTVVHIYDDSHFAVEFLINGKNIVEDLDKNQITKKIISEPVGTSDKEKVKDSLLEFTTDVKIIKIINDVIDSIHAEFKIVDLDKTAEEGGLPAFAFDGKINVNLNDFPVEVDDREVPPFIDEDNFNIFLNLRILLHEYKHAMDVKSGELNYNEMFNKDNATDFYDLYRKSESDADNYSIIEITKYLDNSEKMLLRHPRFMNIVGSRVESQMKQFIVQEWKEFKKSGYTDYYDYIMKE